MKNKLFLSVILFVLAFTINAQNDTMYVMKNGLVEGKYNVNTEIDSVIFYKPTNVTSPTVTDIDGNVYEIVQIGDQLWIAENLKTTKYNDGADIPNVTDGTEWGALSTGAYALHGNVEANGDTYGALYNFYAVETGKLCPSGWHVPTNEEWIELFNFSGGVGVAGDALRETGTTHWTVSTDPGVVATNETGFTALPGGYRTNNGGFLGLTVDNYLWTSSEILYWNISYKRSSVIGGAIGKEFGFSVRCVKD